MLKPVSPQARDQTGPARRENTHEQCCEKKSSCSRQNCFKWLHSFPRQSYSTAAAAVNIRIGPCVRILNAVETIYPTPLQPFTKSCVPHKDKLRRILNFPAHQHSTPPLFPPKLISTISTHSRQGHRASLTPAAVGRCQINSLKQPPTIHQQRVTPAPQLVACDRREGDVAPCTHQASGGQLTD